MACRPVARTAEVYVQGAEEPLALGTGKDLGNATIASFPTYAYLMPAYQRGSVTSLLGDICHRRVDDSVSQRFLNYRAMSSELATLLGELHKIHTTPGCKLMLQDLTPNNILVDDDGSSMRMLFSDPALALPIDLLQQLEKWRSVRGTWLWGSMAARGNRFDPKADLYSLCLTFAEIWLTAEGATLPPMELVQLIGIDDEREQGVGFVRRLMVEVLRTRLHGGSMQPRVSRPEPVAWLGAWALLLGFRDYTEQRQMHESGLPCLRPSEEHMLEVLQLWAHIADAAQALPPDLTDEAALSPAHQPLVCEMTRMLGMLLGLSHLEDAGEQEDGCLSWLAANFMAQKHPLVAAMAVQGSMGVGEREVFGRLHYARRGWNEAVKVAQLAVQHSCGGPSLRALRARFHAGVRRGKEAADALAQLGQWCDGLQQKVQQGLIPAALAQDVLPPESLRLAWRAAAPPRDDGTTAPAASQKRKGAEGAAEQPPGQLPLLLHPEARAAVLADPVGAQAVACVCLGEDAQEEVELLVRQDKVPPWVPALEKHTLVGDLRYATLGSASLAAAGAQAVRSAPAGAAAMQPGAAAGQPFPAQPPEGSPTKLARLGSAGSRRSAPGTGAARQLSLGFAAQQNVGQPSGADGGLQLRPGDGTSRQPPLWPASSNGSGGPSIPLADSGSGAASLTDGPAEQAWALRADHSAATPTRKIPGSTLSYYPECVELYKTTLKAMTDPAAAVGDAPGRRPEFFKAIDTRDKLVQLLSWWAGKSAAPNISDSSGNRMLFHTTLRSIYIRAVAEAARPGAGSHPNNTRRHNNEKATVGQAALALLKEIDPEAAALPSLKSQTTPGKAAPAADISG